MAVCVCSQTTQQLLGLWYHENCRVFQDRLVNDEDRTWFEVLLGQKMKEDFGVEMDDVVTQRPYLFCDFMGGGGEDRDYAYIADHDKVGSFCAVGGGGGGADVCCDLVKGSISAC